MLPRILTATVLALSVFSTVVISAQETPTLAEAHRAYYLGHYGRSLAIYEKLAVHRDAEAAERAGFMLLQGDDVYGPQIQRDLDRAMALLTQAARAGRPAATFILGMLERSD